MKPKILVKLLIVLLIVSCSPEKKGDVLFVVPDENFNLPELEIPLKILKKNGYNVEFTNTTGKLSLSLQGSVIKADKKLSDINSSDYDSISLIGGYGAEQLFDNEDLQKLVVDFNNEDKIVSSQCMSGVILANSGIINNREVTGWPTVEEAIINKGGIFTNTKSQRAGNIITGRGCPSEGDTDNAVKEFTALYLEALNQQLNSNI